MSEEAKMPPPPQGMDLRPYQKAGVDDLVKNAHEIQAPPGLGKTLKRNAYDRATFRCSCGAVWLTHLAAELCVRRAHVPLPPKAGK